MIKEQGSLKNLLKVTKIVFFMGGKCNIEYFCSQTRYVK